MRISAYRLHRQIAGSLVMLLAVPLAAQPQAPLSSAQQGTSAVAQAQPQTAANQSIPEAPTSVKPQANNQDSPQTTQEPLGTAAAPYEKTLGVPASRPAGAVIAPAKQRRKHSLLIKVGLIVGAAAAIGTVVALSKASPGRPN